MYIGEQLGLLETSGLIRLATTPADLEYLFRHALVQDAAYASLLKADRRRLHQLVGETLAQLYADEALSYELAPVLGQHFLEAGDDPQALKYFTLAGDAAAKVYAIAEAIMHYTHALEVARHLPPTSPALVGENNQTVFPHLYLACGRTMQLAGQYLPAVRLYEEMEHLGHERGDRLLTLQALTELATIYSTPTTVHNSAYGQQLLNQALAIAQELGDPSVEARLLWNLMLANVNTGQSAEAVRYGERALRLAREHQLGEQLAFILNDIARPYLGLGQVARAQAAMEEACEFWRATGNQPMLIDNLNQTAIFRYLLGDYDRALLLTAEAEHLARPINNVWNLATGHWFLGMIYVERGELDQALYNLEEAIGLYDRAGFSGGGIGARIVLCELYAAFGRLEPGLEYARLTLAKTEKNLPLFRPWAVVATARLQLLAGYLAEANANLTAAEQEQITEIPVYVAVFLTKVFAALLQARGASVADELATFIQQYRQNGIRTPLVQALLLQGQIFLAQGQLEAARTALNEACSVAETIGARRSLWPSLLALSRVEMQLGQLETAHHLRQQARAVVDFIAQNAPDEWRAAFLQLAEVQELMTAPA